MMTIYKNLSISFANLYKPQLHKNIAENKFSRLYSQPTLKLYVLTTKICNFFVMVNDFVPLGTSQFAALILQILFSQSNTIFKV